MRALVLLMLLLLPAAASAANPPYSRPKYLATYVGIGGAPLVPGPHLIATFDWGLHPFDGAFATGISTSVAIDTHGVWGVLTPGIFVQLDLTYLFLTGFWAVPPPDAFPFRLQVGSRVGLDFSVSQRTRPELTEPQLYMLLRPVLHSYANLEIPVDAERVWSVIVRGAIDTPANLSTIYRWNVAVGFSWGYGT